MAFKLDFNRLGNRTPEERAADEVRRVEEARAAEIKAREAKVKHTRTVTMTGESDVRFEMDGSRSIVFHGTDAQGRPMRGSYQTLSDISADDADALLPRFAQGQTVTLRGYFRPWKDNAGQTQFSFVGLFLD